MEIFIVFIVSLKGILMQFKSRDEVSFLLENLGLASLKVLLQNVVQSFSSLSCNVSILQRRVEIFGFADLANFWFGFSVSALKNCGFSILVSCAICGVSPI